MTTKEPVLTTYTARLLTWLYGEAFPAELAMELDKFQRIGEKAKRANGVIGPGIITWQARERLRIAFGRWLQTADAAERERTIIAADAVARALDRERITGGFSITERDPLPIEAIDQAAHGILRWLRAAGWDVVPATPFDVTDVPETPYARGIGWDIARGVIMRNPLVKRYAPIEDPDIANLEAILPKS